MPSINWSKEQAAAIEARGSNLLVSAAAGSGKTAVLVERIVRRLVDTENPVDLDRLLVVTFTDAAAGEMRQRIAASVNAELEQRPDSGLLQRQLLLLPRAQIGTLHSFCSEVVRSHFYLLGLDPGFRVMDENEGLMLRREVMDAVLEEMYEEHRNAGGESPFLYLADILSGGHGDDRELAETALNLYEFAHSLPRPAAWLRRLPAALKEFAARSWEDQFWVDDWREMLELEMGNWLENLDEALRLAAGPGGPDKYLEVLTGDREKVRSCLGRVRGTFSGLQEAVEKSLHWPKLPPVARGEADEKIKKRIQHLRNGVKKRAGEFHRDFFSRPPGEMTADFQRAAPVVGALVETVLRFKESYQRAKMERAIVDFSDLEHYALAILSLDGEGSPWGKEAPEEPEQPLLPSPVARQYRDHFREVLVDEYQDVNGVQEAMLRLVSREDNRFLVGDVKQSIYRFRLADPMVFLRCYRQFGDLHAGTGTGQGRRADLTSNFRSRAPVLHAVNYIFERLMNRRVAEVDYDERARLNPGNAYPESVPEPGAEAVEFHLLEYAGPPEGEGAEGDTESEPEDLNLLQLEARWVAERIYRMVVEEGYRVFDREKESYRRVNWRDVVVLMRSPRRKTGTFLEELRRLGIPAYADGSGGYFAAPEVQTILSLLQVIDNPHRDIPLAAVLRSVLVGLGASSLAEIRLSCPEGDFYEAVCRTAEQAEGKDGDTAERLRGFLRRLEEWRDLARRVSPAELLEELYRQTGFYDAAGAVPGGAIRRANLRALVDRARRFEGSAYRGLFRFLRFIEQVQEGGGDMDTARSLGENEDVVRLMSIHRAKGLEFPVVFVAGMGSRFNLRDLSGNFLWHRRLGCGPAVVDLEKGIRYPTVLHRVNRHRLRLESLAEEMRLLYVAFTRAREKLILTAAAKDPRRLVDAWQSQVSAPAPVPLSASLLAAAQGPLDWLGPAFWSHPAAHGLGYNGERLDAGGECWRVFLRPAASLQSLWVAQSGENEPGEEAWLKKLRNLEPLAEEWMNQRKEDYPTPGSDELRRRLRWQYPFLTLAGLPSKVTVTGWKRRQEEEWKTDEAQAPPPAGMQGVLDPGRDRRETGADLPAFYTGKGDHGTERGRVMHLVMENLDLDPPPDEGRIKLQLDRMVQREILRPVERELVRPDEIARFFAGSLGKRFLVAAGKGCLWREVPFTLGLPAAELYPELGGDGPEKKEQVLLQGVIDCLFWEGEEPVIIDYKTDRPAGEEPEVAASRYKVQMDLYARAVEDILGRPVRERYLYFFARNRAVAI